MEPSLRSSRPPAIGCVLPRTDQSLHESATRLVESLSDDIRISQYADIPFAMKKMEGRIWYWLKSIPGAKMGFLVCQPKMPIVWVDEQLKISYKIPIRLASSVLEKKSVFLASLNRTMGILQLEDCWMSKGSFIRSQKFSERWKHILKLLQSEFREDRVLQKGFLVQAAQFVPLKDLKSFDPLPPFLLAQGEDYSRRLRVQIGEKNTTRPLFVQEDVPVVAPVPVAAPVSEVSEEGTAIAVPHDEYPDTYNLFIGGQKKGYAAVQDLALSRTLKAAAAANSKLVVRIEWNEEFKMYEILSLV